MKEKRGRTHKGIEKAKCGKAHKNKQAAGKITTQLQGSIKDLKTYLPRKKEKSPNTWKKYTTENCTKNPVEKEKS